MKLTPENLDYMDCRPGGEPASIKIPPEIGEAIADKRGAATVKDQPEPTSRSRWRALSAAVDFALEIHADQVRKGADTPYIGHLLGVASLVLEHGGDEEQAMAGMLHDAIEDQGLHQEQAIADRFGARVARIVRACTDADTTPKPPWRARKEAYIAHLEHADTDALLVSAADKLHNARAILTDLRTHGLAVFDRFTGGQDGTIWYYQALAEVFGRRMPSPIAADLAGTRQQLCDRQPMRSEPPGNRHRLLDVGGGPPAAMRRPAIRKIADQPRRRTAPDRASTARASSVTKRSVHSCVWAAPRFALANTCRTRLSRSGFARPVKRSKAMSSRNRS